MRLLALLALAPLVALAQKHSVGTIAYPNFNTSTSIPIDTLGLFDFLETQSMLYASPNGGYAFGNNGYSDQVKAQTYEIDTVQGRYLRGVLVMFDGVTIGNTSPDTSWIELLVYEKGGRAYPQSGPIDTTIGPVDSSLVYAAITIDQVNQNGFTYFDVAWQNKIIKGEIFFAIRFTRLLQGDTLGIVSSANGEGAQQYRVWELNAYSDWVNVGNVTRSWGLDVNLAIFPVVDHQINIGIKDDLTAFMRAYPNPNIDQILKIDGLSEGTYSLSLPDGREVKSDTFFNSKIDLTGISKGMYLLRISNPNFHFNQRLIIQ